MLLFCIYSRVLSSKCIPVLSLFQSDTGILYVQNSYFANFKEDFSRRDAEDAVKELDGARICGSK